MLAADATQALRKHAERLAKGMKILNSIEAVSQFKILTKRSSDRGLWHLAAHHAKF